MTSTSEAGARSFTERSEATTAELLAEARRLFAADGFGATSIDDIVRAAGVTKGALYHHFRSKADLFRSVYVAEERRLASALTGHVDGSQDPWSRLRAGCRGFLAEALDPHVRQIVLLDAPSVLGLAVVRDIEADSTASLLRVSLDLAAEDGVLRPGDLDSRTALLTGALCDAAILVARAEDQPAALELVTRELDHLLSGFRAR
ncbi:MAG: TetR/AcrR family transcriptional regulator [Iamia sp.]